MQRFIAILCCALASVSSASLATAQTNANADLLVIADGTRYVVPMLGTNKFGTDYKIWQVGAEGQGWGVETAEFKISVTGTADYDPSIGYGVAVTDFGAPSIFGFFFASPILPVGTPNTVRSSLAGALTDFTGDGVSLMPTLADADGDTLLELQTSDVTAPLTNMGVDVGTGVSFPAGASGALYAVGPFAVGPQAGPGPGPWTGLQASLGFSLSGNGDIAVLTGFAEILPIPEPSALALAGMLAGLFALRQRSARLIS
jgi:hypothetical protein